MCAHTDTVNGSMTASHPAHPSKYQSDYDPSLILSDAEFKVLAKDDPDMESSKINLACFYNERHEINMVRKPIPHARKGECIVHIRATGICGSDVHFWKHGQIGPTMIVQDECGSGHESAGIVIEVGEGVVDFAVGDRVAVEAGLPCSQPACEACRTGVYNACPRMVFFSTPPYHGTLTRYHAHPAAWLHKLPENVSFEEGALCEPLAVALAGLQRAKVELGDPVVICGAGPIGLVSALCAQAAGCTPIVITDVIESRLKFAQTLIPASRTVLLRRDECPKEAAAKVKAAANGAVSVALECTGFESSIRTAIYSLEFGGKCMVIGVGQSEQSYPFGYCSANQIVLDFLYRYAHQYPKALRLVSSGLVDLRPLVTHRFPLNDAVEAFETAADPRSGAIKVQITDG